MDDNTRQVLLSLVRLLNKLLDKLPAITAVALGYSMREEILEIVREITGALL